MDQAYEVFTLYAEQFSKMPMFPVFQCVHFILMTLKLRLETGSLSFAYSHPLSSWAASLLTCFAGTLMSNFLLGKPLISPLMDMQQMAVLTVVWYLVFFCPLDLFTKIFMLKPVWVILLIGKEAHRAKNILAGVQMASSLYSDAWLVIIAVGTTKGAGSRLIRPAIKFIQGQVVTDNEALYPSFVTKLSIAGSILFIMVQRRTVELSIAEVLVGIACIGSFLQVLMYLTLTNDPFLYLEKAVAAILFREPSEKADTADSKKKKE